MQVKVNEASQQNSLRSVKMALICAQCIESGRLTARSDPVLYSSASVSASTGEGGGLRREDTGDEAGWRSHQAGFKTVATDHVLELWSVKEEDAAPGSGHRGVNWLRCTTPTQRPPLQVKRHQLFSARQHFPVKESQSEGNLQRAAGSLILSKPAPLLRWRPRARLSEAAVCRPAPA